MFVQQCTTKQESAAEYSEYAVAREEVVCDFIGELLSEQKTLETFCESIKSGEINAETARGIVAAWRKITGILRGKGVKQTDTATAALVQRVQEQFGTGIETAENAVRKMQKALSAAMKTEKNTANESGVKHSEKTRTQDKSRWEERHKWAVYEAVQDALDHGDNGDDNLIKSEKFHRIYLIYPVSLEISMFIEITFMRTWLIKNVLLQSIGRQNGMGTKSTSMLWGKIESKTRFCLSISHCLQLQKPEKMEIRSCQWFFL